jgi:hypothetical protein
MWMIDVDAASATMRGDSLLFTFSSLQYMIHCIHAKCTIKIKKRVLIPQERILKVGIKARAGVYIDLSDHSTFEKLSGLRQLIGPSPTTMLTHDKVYFQDHHFPVLYCTLLIEADCR